jgi:D-3-phosphoglycerate dehydrogenase / 2-oxoglutarate reductase
MKVLVVGDSYFPAEVFGSGFGSLADRHELEFMAVTGSPGFVASTPSELRLREFQGAPKQVASRLTDHDVLIVHGAPVTEEVLRASPELALVGCARGGPVNVDVQAARELGVTVTTAPGKNAHSVADLTMAFAVILARALPRAESFLREGNRLTSAFDGAEFFGLDLLGLRLGLVGLGRVAREVSARAISFGMEILAYDPLVDEDTIRSAGARAVMLEELFGEADIISLHARQTAENRHMIDRRLLALSKPGTFLINTAREGLVDESALVEALSSGRLAAAALDVFEPDGAVNDLLVSGSELLDRLVITPHIGGATQQTLERGAQMMASEIDRFAKGEPLLYAVG